MAMDDAAHEAEAAGRRRALADKFRANAKIKHRTKTPKRIVYVQAGVWRAMGAEDSCMKFLDCLRQMGHEVLYLYEGAAAVIEFAVPGVGIERLPSRDALLAREAELAPDVTFTCNSTWRLADRLRGRRRAAMVYYWMGLLREPQRRHLWRGDWSGVDIEGLAAIQAHDLVVANSDYTADLLRTLGVRPAVIEPFFGMAERIAQEPRIRDVAGLWVGWEKFGQAVTALAREVPGQRFMSLAYDAMQVPPPHEPNLEVKRFESDMSRAYGRARTCIHQTFLSESFCVTAVEAMANGLPVIYPADRGNVRNLVGDAGLGVPVDSAAAAAAALEEIERGWPEFSARGAARAKVLADFPGEAQTEAVLGGWLDDGAYQNQARAGVRIPRVVDASAADRLCFLSVLRRGDTGEGGPVCMEDERDAAEWGLPWCPRIPAETRSFADFRAWRQAYQVQRESQCGRF